MTTSLYNEFLTTLPETGKLYPPVQLFAAGDPTLLCPCLKIAVVGCRNATPKGIEDARNLTKTLVWHGATIVSGLAEGIDTVAHETAIHSGGKTIAVLGTPLNTCYPTKNKALLDTIKTDHLAVSQFPPGSRMRPGNFPLRNRTIALVSHATVIVEASQTGGTSHMGWETLHLCRPLFLLRSVIENPALSWPKQMLKFGARELTRNSLPFFLSTCQINPIFTQSLQP